MGKNVIFVFSSSQYKMRKETEKTIGKIYTPGVVLVNGNYKQFTEILSDIKDSRFPDAQIVASGDIDKIKYKKR